MSKSYNPNPTFLPLWPWRPTFALALQAVSQASSLALLSPAPHPTPTTSLPQSNPSAALPALQLLPLALSPRNVLLCSHWVPVCAILTGRAPTKPCVPRQKSPCSPGLSRAPSPAPSCCRCVTGGCLLPPSSPGTSACPSSPGSCSPAPSACYIERRGRWTRVLTKCPWRRPPWLRSKGSWQETRRGGLVPPAGPGGGWW